MDINRVKQILSSSAEIDVKYHGVSVWIDSCDETGMVMVHMRGDHNDKRNVPAAELIEE